MEVEGQGCLLSALLKRSRSAVERHLGVRAVEAYKSRLPRVQARRYEEYLRRCRRLYPGTRPLSVELRRAIADFQAKGFAAFWTEDNEKIADSIFSELKREEQAGLDIWNADSRYREEIYRRFPQIEALFRGSLGEFLEAVYGAYFKIFYGVLYKSQHSADQPTGSQLWHYDGGPGTCINVMLYLKGVTREDGAMECVPWSVALEIYRREMRDVPSLIDDARRMGGTLSREELRSIKTTYLGKRIAEAFADRVEQPMGRAGLVVPFRNNSLHRGGFPDAGHSRYVCVFHCYPSDRPTPYHRYGQSGIPKRAPYPADPAEDF